MKICFVVEDIYPTLNPKGGELYLNGRSIHFKNLGQGLLKEGHEVSFITRDYGGAGREEILNFLVYKMYKPDEGIPVLRFYFNKIPKLIKALKEANADIYVFMCPDPFVGIISWYCRKESKKFIYYGGSDKDFVGNSWRISFRDYFLFRKGLKNADLVLCQNRYQVATLERYYGGKGVILYNPMEPEERTYNPEGSIMWIANYRPVKHPEIFIELSRKIDDSFVMIGGIGNRCTEREYALINEKAKNNNIEILGSLGYSETDKLLSGAKLLVNTSESEGLSNTFLQAWRRGIPVVSFVDPDDMIKRNNLGLVVNNFTELVSAVEKLKKGITEDESVRIKEYFDKTFSTEIIAKKFSELVKEIV